MADKKYLLRLFSFFLIIVSLVYLGKFVKENLQTINMQEALIMPSTFLLCLGITLAGHFSSSYVWYRIIARIQPGVSKRDCLRSWAWSRLARYIPGKLLPYLLRYGLLPELSSHKVTKATIVEVLSYLLSLALLGGIALILYFNNLTLLIKASFLIPIAASLLILTLSAFLATTKKMPELMRPLLISKGEVPPLLSMALVQAGVSLIHGLAFYVALSAFTEVDPGKFFYIVALYYLAGLIGQMAILSPSGLGVREAALLALLTPVIGNDAGLIIAVLWIRIILVSSELLLALISEILHKKLISV